MSHMKYTQVAYCFLPVPSVCYICYIWITYDLRMIYIQFTYENCILDIRHILHTIHIQFTYEYWVPHSLHTINRAFCEPQGLGFKSCLFHKGCLMPSSCWMKLRLSFCETVFVCKYFIADCRTPLRWCSRQYFQHCIFVVVSNRGKFRNRFRKLASNSPHYISWSCIINHTSRWDWSFAGCTWNTTLCQQQINAAQRRSTYNRRVLAMSRKEVQGHAGRIRPLSIVSQHTE